MTVCAGDLGIDRSRNWVAPFMDANRMLLRRLEVTATVTSAHETCVALCPGSRVGAVPLLHPTTRRVAAGLLVEPRFQWTALGAVMSDVGFDVAPALGGAPEVPGSAREVPPWIIAGPVIRRIAGLLAHRKRAFSVAHQDRTSPRGRVDWGAYATRHASRGQLTVFPCSYTEPGDDPLLAAQIRWTLKRLLDDLTPLADSAPARLLIAQCSELQRLIGAGVMTRPSPHLIAGMQSEWLLRAREAMGWVAEERGLGGSRMLDGLSWDLSVAALWEAWVASMARSVAGSLGLRCSPYQVAQRTLRWTGAVQSMGALRPDVELHGADRIIWIDAKYKRHLQQLAYRGWSGATADLQAEHRADLHQALAYAALADTPQVDTLLMYPDPAADEAPLAGCAVVTSGRRTVRLFLAGAPFGFRNAPHKERYLNGLRQLLATG